MSDGITDAHRESRFKPKPLSSSITQNTHMPERCNNCIFITRNPHDNQWECTNPLQHGKCDEPNNCAFHITLEELAVYLRQRLKAKLIKEPTMLNKSPRCKHILDNGKCSKLDNFQCPFVGMQDIAVTLCKSYEADIRYEVHVLGNSTSIIGVFKSREQAEQFIKDNVKVVEMTS